MMDEMKRGINKDDMTQTFDRCIAWIENCDTKASITLGGLGVILSILLASDYVKKISEVFQYMLDNIGFLAGLHLCLTTLSLLAVVVGILFLLRVLIPKIDTKEFEDKEIVGDSLIFFSTIAKNKSFATYKAKIEDCSEGGLLDDMLSQIYICSLICEMKFRNYKTGLFLSIMGFLLFAAMMIIGIIAL